MPTHARHHSRRAWPLGAFAVWLVVSLPLAALVMVASAPRAQAASTVSVEISNFAFQPATVTIQVGDTVTWTNLDSAPHTATDTASSPLFDGVMSTGQSFSYTFTRAGTIDYFCTYHPEMTGTVIVQSEVPDAAMPLPSAWAATVLGVALLVLSLLVAVGGAGPRRPAARR